MKSKMVFVVAIVVLALFLPGRASAACSGSEVTLTNNNFGFNDVSVTVCITHSGGNTIITLENVTGDAATGAFTFINQIGINGTASNTFVDAFHGSTSLGWKPGPGNCSGFDGFQTVYTACGQGGGGLSGNAVDEFGEYWVFSGTVSPDQLVFHVAFANCTGFIGGSATTNSTDAGSSCASVPETSSGVFSLLGIAFLASVGILRRLVVS